MGWGPRVFDRLDLAVVGVGMVVVGLGVGVHVAADSGDDRVDVTTSLVKGEDLFAWINVPDGDRMYRCLVLVENLDGLETQGKAAALWCERQNR